MIDVSRYQKKHWIKGQYDCWSLVRDVYRHERGIDLPVIVVDVDNLRAVVQAFRDEANLAPWMPIDRAEHLSLVYLSAGQHMTSHCGVWLDMADGRFLHLPRNSSVVCEDRLGLDRNGWCEPKFYRYVGTP